MSQSALFPGIVKRQSWHDTTPLPRHERDAAELKVRGQEKRILALFTEPKTPSEIHADFPPNVPLTSIRRGISNLTRKGALIKTEATKAGPFGSPEHVWRKTQ